jgi:hypothetical protein
MKNKEILEINLSQFGVWEDLQMIYLPFYFNFLLLIEFWVLLNGPRFNFTTRPVLFSFLFL